MMRDKRRRLQFGEIKEATEQACFQARQLREQGIGLVGEGIGVGVSPSVSVTSQREMSFKNALGRPSVSGQRN